MSPLLALVMSALLAIPLSPAPASAPAPASPFGVEPVSNTVLAEQRGGFRLPNGIDVALTVQSVTSVNGVVVLHTTFRVDQGPPTIAIHTSGREGQDSGTSTQQNRTISIAATPTVGYDPRNGVQITPGVAAPSIRIATVAQDMAASASPGEVASEQSANAFGAIEQSQQNGVHSISLQGPDIAVTHLAGTTFGSIVANSGNDRAIDTATTISLDLRNAGPDVLGSAMLRVGNLGNDALAFRGL